MQNNINFAKNYIYLQKNSIGFIKQQKKFFQIHNAPKNVSKFE